MNQKPSPLAALKSITPEQADQLFELLRVTPYYAAVKWVGEQWHLTVSVSGLRRWWARETKARSRADLRNAIKASEQFDKDLDTKALDERAANALRAAYWQAISSGDQEAIKTFASLVLDYNVDKRGFFDIDIKRKALAVKENQLALAREKFEAAEARLAQAKTTLSDTALTPAEREAKLKSLFGIK